ncbi:MAG: ABC transporter ATP-binding protein [Inconstantimicrobium porci]|uniref:ABC transporter ATP-binding protein n=1 Tax=Inconstantimicrobium porci TaxID=2652291 RepID=UPI002A912D5E|nr:ABC transporter ATP-binding protein [Inconstantimicrobium porci]MDY5911457.1 ABC transporter ATP-binding protein [Inconstantimicrobium porci]
MSILTLKNICKTYGKGNAKVNALNNIDLDVNKGELIAIMGPSGCGKSTLLNILGCIDTPDSGSYFLDGQDVDFKKINGLSDVRNHKVSFVFQNFALIKEFTVMDNVLLPLKFRKTSKKQRTDTASKYLKELDIWSLRKKHINELSGGQQQRVAISRALCQETEIILADEPTGALDEENSKKIMDIFCSLNKKLNKTIIIVTHNPIVADYCDRTLHMKDGRWIDK